MQHVHSTQSIQVIKRLGLSWPELDEALAQYERVRKIHRQHEGDLHSLTAEIRQLSRADQRALAEAHLAGERGGAENPQIRELEERRRALQRENQTLVNESIPRAESALASAIGLGRPALKEKLLQEAPQVRGEYEAAIAEVAQLIMPKAQKLADLHALLDWTESNNPLTYSGSAPDRAVSPAIAALHEYANAAQARENRYAEEAAEAEREQAERRRRVEAGEVKVATEAGV